MADDTVVSIGAKIDGVLAALGSVQQQLTGMAAAADKVHQSFTKLASLTAGALGLGFTISAMDSFVRKMGEAGLHSEQLKAQLGVSAAGLGEMRAVAKLTGVDIDSMAMGMNRLSLNVQSATKDSFSPQAQALRVLGLSTKELIGLSADQYFAKFRDAVSGFNPSMNLTNALVAVGGRSMLQMLPALLMGKDAFEKWGQQLRDVRYGLEGFSSQGSDTHARLVVLDAAMDSAAKRIFLTLKPAIDLIIGALTEFFKLLDTKTIMAWSKAVVDYMGAAVSGMVVLFYTLGGSIDAVLAKLTRLLSGMAAGALAGGIAGGGMFGALAGAAGGATIIYWWDKFFSDSKTGSQHAVEGLNEDQKAVLAKIKEFTDNLRGSIDNVSGGGAGGGGKTAGGLNLSAKVDIETMNASLQGMVALWNGWAAQKAVIYQRDSDLWATTEQQKLRSTRDTMALQQEAVINLMTAQRDAWPATTRDWEEANRKLIQATQGFKTQMLQINADIVRDLKRLMDEVGNALMSSFNSQLRGLLAGTTSWKNAFKSIMGDMVIFAIQAVEKMVVNWATGQLAMVVASLAGEAAKTGAAAEGAAARGAIDIAAALEGIATALAETFAKLTAWFVGVFGPYAPLAAAATVAGIGATAYGMIKGYAVGTDYVPYTGLAMVHQGEKIISAEDNRNGGSGGGDTYHLTIHAVDARSIRDLFMQNGGALVDALSRQKRMGKSFADAMGG